MTSVMRATIRRQPEDLRTLFGDVALRVIDDDMNAVYGNWPQAWGHIGLTANAFQPRPQGGADCGVAKLAAECLPVKLRRCGAMLSRQPAHDFHGHVSASRRAAM